MTPDNSAHKHNYDRGSILCQDLAERVLDDYTAQLIDMVENSTHGLSIADIRTFLDSYKQNRIDADKSVFKAHFQRCLNRREQEVFDPNRRDPFKRVLTMRFVDLFPPEGALDGSGIFLSRRVLRGLFKTLEKMTGTEPFTHGNMVCMDVMEETKNDDGIVIWEDLYHDERALDAADDMLMSMVPHFEPPMHRIEWMLTLINNDLSDPLEFDFEGDANVGWELDEVGLVNILRHLFRHLRHQLTDREHAQALAARYGAERARQLAALIKVLDHAEA